MRIHTGEKPFRCEFNECGLSFTTLGHLIDHKRKHTQQDCSTFQCQLCDKEFFKARSLKLH